MGLLEKIFWKNAAAQRRRVDHFYVSLVKNDVPEVRRLLAEGMNPNQVFSGYQQARPLHLAALKGQPEMIDLLLTAGAEPLVGIRINAVTTLSPAGFARMMKRTENAEHLQTIEDERRREMIAQGLVPPVFSEKVTTICQRLSSHREKSSRPQPPP